MTTERTSLRSPGQLTARQRTVLELVAKGRTNGEIASELGISFDTAKSHVSEILGRLGVDSPEEAADWWRRENGYRARVLRFASLPAMTAASKLVAAAAVVIVMVAGIAAVLYALNGDDDSASSPNDSSPSPATPIATATAPSAGASPSVTASPGAVIAQDFQQGAPIDLPDGVVLYYSWAGIEVRARTSGEPTRTATAKSLTKSCSRTCRNIPRAS